MKFIIIISIILFSFTNEAKSSTLYGNLKRGSSQTLYSSGYGLYLDTHEYYDTNEIEIKVTLHNGYFVESLLYYGGNEKIYDSYDTINHPLYLTYNSTTHGSYSNTYYKYYTYYYMVPKLQFRYLYISLPRFYTSTSGYLVVNGFNEESDESTDKESDSNYSAVVAISIFIGVVIFMIVIMVVIISIRRAKRKSSASPLFNSYSQPMNHQLMNQIENPPATQPYIPPVTQPFIPPVTQPYTPPVTQPYSPPVKQPYAPPVKKPYDLTEYPEFSGYLAHPAPS